MVKRKKIKKKPYTSNTIEFVARPTPKVSKRKTLLQQGQSKKKSQMQMGNNSSGEADPTVPVEAATMDSTNHPSVEATSNPSVEATNNPSVEATNNPSVEAPQISTGEVDSVEAVEASAKEDAAASSLVEFVNLVQQKSKQDGSQEEEVDTDNNLADLAKKSFRDTTDEISGRLGFDVSFSTVKELHEESNKQKRRAIREVLDEEMGEIFADTTAHDLVDTDEEEEEEEENEDDIGSLDDFIASGDDGADDGNDSYSDSDETLEIDTDDSSSDEDKKPAAKKGGAAKKVGKLQVVVPQKSGKRRAGEPPVRVRQQMDNKVREKIEQLELPVQNVQIMSTPLARLDGDYQLSRGVIAQQLAFPNVIHGAYCYTEQPPNADGSNTNHFLDTPVFHFWTPSKKQSKALSEVIQPVVTNGVPTCKFAFHESYVSYKAAFEHEQMKDLPKSTPKEDSKRTEKKKKKKQKNPFLRQASKSNKEVDYNSDETRLPSDAEDEFGTI